MTDDAQRVASFLRRAGELKRVPRTGWVDRGIPPAEIESVADHSWRVVLMAWLLSTEMDGLDRDRSVLLALLHDLAESVTGDLPPYDPEAIPPDGDPHRTALFEQRQIMPEDRREAKRIAEEEAIAGMVDELPERMRNEIAAPWRELAERTTPEARFVKEIDRLETFLQSREYLAIHPDLPVKSFLLEVHETLETPLLRELRDAVSPRFPDE